MFIPYSVLHGARLKYYHSQSNTIYLHLNYKDSKGHKQVKFLCRMTAVLEISSRSRAIFCQ
jgi:hypothetical protein